MGSAGEETLVTFELSTPEIGTKAIGDGTTATALSYAVYDDAGHRIPGLNGATTLSGLKATVSMTLVNGKEYSLIFFAQKELESAVSVDFDSKEMTFNPTLANQESYDAFWAYVEPFTVTGPVNKNVQLKRPFAQLNIGTSDYDAYETAGGTAFSEVAVGVQTVYNTMNLVTGAVSGNVAAAYASEAFPTESFPVATSPAQEYLAMNYVLVGEEKQVVDVTLTYAGQTQTYTNVPVQRNYRTNIYGTLLTNSANFNVEVIPGFGGLSNVEVLEQVVNDVDELNTALAANTTINNIIYTIKGCSAETDVTVTIPNSFVASHVTFNFIDLSVNCNLTINGATFANDATILTPAGVKLGDLVVEMPNAHVNLTAGSFTTVTAHTSSSTLVIGSEVEIGALVVDGGSVELEAGADVDSLEAGVGNNDPIVVYIEDEADMPIVDPDTTVIKADAESKNDPSVEGNVIKLTEDVTLSNIWVLDSDVVLDGDGHTLTSTAGRAINVSGANNVTIKNLTINASGERAINIIQNTKNVTIDNVTATASNYTVNVAASAPGAEVSINESTLTGLNVVNVAAASAVVTVTNSTINCNDQNKTEGESYAALCLNKDAKGGTITATGCTIDVTPESDSSKGRNGAEDGTVTIDGSTEGVIVTVAVITYVGSNYYHGFETLADAVEFASAGDVITLIRDVEVSEIIKVVENITIDLNGKTITGTDTTDKNFSILDNRSNLTIKNTAATEGKLTLTATINSGWNRYSAVVANNPGGNLTVEEGVIIEHLGGTDMAYGIDNLTNGKGTSAITTINGATVKSTYRAVRQFLNGVQATNELYVNSGIIEGVNKSIWMQDPSKNANTGKMVVKGAAQLKGDVYLFVTAGSTEWPVEVSIAKEALVGESEILTGNVPTGYELVEVDGIYSIRKN